jgi:hypothetical protein
LDEGNCAAARPGGFRREADKTGREASRNKNLESKRRAHEQFRAEGDIPTSEARKATGCEAGDADELASFVAGGYGGTSHTAKSGYQRQR